MKVAVVTGAHKGLGFAWCKVLAEQGYEVVLTARKESDAKNAAETLAKNGLSVKYHMLDVTSEKSIADLSMWLGETYGKVDVLINNAGVNPKDFSDKERMAKAFYLDALDGEVMSQVLLTNSIAPLLMIKHLRPLLRQATKPVVIHISSWLGSVSNLHFGGHYGYVGSKNLLNVLNKSMSFELQADGIISICVNPGWVRTDMGGSKAQFSAEEAVGNLYHNILSQANSAMSGQFLNYDGSVHPW